MTAHVSKNTGDMEWITPLADRQCRSTHHGRDRSRSGVVA